MLLGLILRWWRFGARMGVAALPARRGGGRMALREVAIRRRGGLRCFSVVARVNFSTGLVYGCRRGAVPGFRLADLVAATAEERHGGPRSCSGGQREDDVGLGGSASPASTRMRRRVEERGDAGVPYNARGQRRNVGKTTQKASSRRSGKLMANKEPITRQLEAA